MKTLQVSIENRNGKTLRGIVTIPQGNEKVPVVVNLHGFGGNAMGFKYSHTHLARRLAKQGVACVRFDFYGCGESDGEFEEMSFDGLHTDAKDIYNWVLTQDWADTDKIFLSGQSLGGYIAASVAPTINPYALILMCPGCGMWYYAKPNADNVKKTGKDYADVQGLIFKIDFNYEMAAHPDPYEEAKGYNGPVIILRAEDDKLVDEATCKKYQDIYLDSRFITTSTGGHNFASLAAREECEKAICDFITQNL